MQRPQAGVGCRGETDFLLVHREAVGGPQAQQGTAVLWMLAPCPPHLSIDNTSHWGDMVQSETTPIQPFASALSYTLGVMVGEAAWCPRENLWDNQVTYLLSCPFCLEEADRIMDLSLHVDLSVGIF